MNQPSFILIGSDGTVLAAIGDVPAGLLDVRLQDCDAVGQEVRDGAHTLLREVRVSGRAAGLTIPLPGAVGPVHLLAADALAIRRTPTDLKTLLASKLAVMFSQATTAGITLRIEHGVDVPRTVLVDAEKISWAVTTLVGNALRYAQTGSRDLRGRSIAVATTYDRNASEIAVEVKDDGPGVPADTVSRLFRRDGLNVRGAGLSLLLISDIMAAHGGRIDVQSSTDPATHGTAVRLTFPAD
jgi:signal transduction histidine kinase